jgi:hypothetical protein
MVPKDFTRKTLFAAVICAAFLAASSSMAEGYKPDEFLNLDLSKAALSPKPLGPASQFEPVPVQAEARNRAADVVAKPKAAAKVRIAHTRAEKPRAPARTKLTRKHGNPLDAQASDPWIQVWPCRSGGICNWQR